MKNRIILFLASLALLVGCAEQKEYDLYLLIGQSNMAGRGHLIESDTLADMEGVYILNQEGEVVKARNPLNKYSTIGKEYKMQQMSPAYSFAKKVHEQTGRKILLVVNARGGTNIQQWLPDNKPNKFYTEAVRRTKEAMEYGDLKAILWHQGCGDKGDERREQYMGKLNKMVTSLRTDLGDDDLYFVAGELGDWRESAIPFNEMLQTISSNIENADCISSKGAPRRSDLDDPHFSREGQMILGERYAEKVLERIYNLKAANN